MEVGDYVSTRMNILDIKKGTIGTVIKKYENYVDVRFRKRYIVRVLKIDIEDLQKIEFSRL